MGRESRRQRREAARQLAKSMLDASPQRSKRDWIIAIGLPGVLAAGLFLMSTPITFWLGVICLYLFLAWVAVLVAYELWRRREGRAWKIAGIMTTAVVALLFTGFVFRPSPLPIEIKFIGIGFSGNAGGIEWQPDFGQVRLEITNPTNRDYDNFTAVFEPGVEIMAITSTSLGLDVHLERLKTKSDIKLDKILTDKGITMNGMTWDGTIATGLTTVDHKTGQKGVFPLAPMGNGPSTSYRIRCDKLTRGSTLEAIVAIARLTDVKRMLDKGSLVVPLGAVNCMRLVGSFESLNRSVPFDSGCKSSQ